MCTRFVSEPSAIKTKAHINIMSQKTNARRGPRPVRGGTQPQADLLTGPTTRDTHAGELEKCL